MGAHLVKLAYIYAADVPLNPNEFRLLSYMALTALDDDTTPRYFDSRESSALALGRRVVDEGYGDEDDARYRTAAFEAVKVATRGLVALGAISRIKTGRTGQRAEFALHLDTARTRASEEYAARKAKEGRAFPTRKGEPSPQGRPSLPAGEGPAFPPRKGEPSPKEPLQEPLRNHRGQTAGITTA